MNRIYFFATASNGYNRGCIQAIEDEDVLDAIYKSCDVLGYENYIVTICKNISELDEMEEIYLSKQ